MENQDFEPLYLKIADVFIAQSLFYGDEVLKYT